MPAGTSLIVSTCDIDARRARFTNRASQLVQKSGIPKQTLGPTYSRPMLGHSYQPPTSDVECHIAAIFEQLLGIDGIGRLDNFFEMGGHSLMAIQVVSHVRRSLHVEITLRQLFDSPTVAGLSALVEATMQTDGDLPPRLQRRDVRSEVLLSSAQGTIVVH